MKLVEPDDYQSFRCAAGRCPDTCCTAWEVILDEETLQKYRNLPGPFGQKVRRSIYFHDGAWMFRTQAGRCPLLTREGLCDVQLHGGEPLLCRTCREYPKFVSEYGLLQERGLSLSCPEVCRNLLTRETPISFVAYENDQPLTGLHDLDAEVFAYLHAARGEALALAQNRTLPVRQRLASVLIYAQRLQQQIDTGRLSPVPPLPSFTPYPARPAALWRTVRKWLHALLDLEILSSSEWQQRLLTLQELVEGWDFRQFDLPWEETTASEQLLVYYVYKFFLRGAYHKDIQLQAQLIAFFWCMQHILLHLEQIRQGQALTEAEKIDWVHRFARETEHSDENLSALLRRMSRFHSFSCDVLLRILLQNRAKNKKRS